MQKEMQQLLKNLDRYKNFTLLEKPIKFKDFQHNMDIEVVQLHSLQTFDADNNGNKDIVGFCGVCTWKDNVLSPLDGDSYSDEMLVYGYEWWTNEEKHITKGLDILVGDDW